MKITLNTHILSAYRDPELREWTMGIKVPDGVTVDEAAKAVSALHLRGSLEPSALFAIRNGNLQLNSTSPLVWSWERGAATTEAVLRMIQAKSLSKKVRFILVFAHRKPYFIG
jgi:hypothetical protein